MGQLVNEELEKLSKTKKYSLSKERKLSDIATAYISDEFKGVDESLKAVRKMRKALLMAGFSLQEIDDFLIERSYITKKQISNMFNQSIYNEDCSLIPVVECIPFHTDKTTTDIIIDELKTRPELLKALQNKVTASNLTRDYKVKNSTLLINFYRKHKDIITE